MVTMAKQLLEKMFLVLRTHYGGDYSMKLSHDESVGVFSLITQEAMMFYTLADRTFFITFTTGTPAKFAANYIKLASLVFEFEEYVILDDSYFDNTKEQLIFGDAAEQKREEDMHTARGRKKCPICDGVYLKKFFKEEYCLNCDNIKDALSWH